MPLTKVAVITPLCIKSVVTINNDNNFTKMFLIIIAIGHINQNSNEKKKTNRMESRMCHVLITIK